MQNTINISELRASVSMFTKSNTPRALIIFAIDMAIYIASFFGIILFESLAMKLLCSIVFGLKMASLFVIAHDAAHDSYTENKLLNRVIGRLAFLTSFHNFSLWLIAHNRKHHQLTNLQGVNSWSPLSKSDYDKLPTWRQRLERFYRTPAGISLNYLVERWWKDKFFPYQRLIKDKEKHLVYWLDFSLVSTFLFAQIIFWSYIGFYSNQYSVLGMLTLGIFIPMIVFCFLVGFSVYQQHTHEQVPWFKTRSERDQYGHVEDITVHVRYPKWYNVVSHNVMEHTAHHVDPRIPLYHLPAAQVVIMELLGDDMMTISFSFQDTLLTMKRCKLYDYDNHCWLDFNGDRTSDYLLDQQQFAIAA